jgi:GAF domain-containing protein
MDPERRKLVDDIQEAIAVHHSETDILQAAVRLIDAFSEGFNWTGFYMMRHGALEVGPYVGPVTEHTRIELNRGVCGAAASKKETVMVDDVRADPRFIACSLGTRSEIVVPLMDGDTCLGEIDVDSDQPAFFTDEDREMLEMVAEVIVSRLRALRL